MTGQPTAAPAPNGCRRGLPGCTGFVLRWQVFSNGTTHLRESCAFCRTYIRYAPQTPENLALAGPRPEILPGILASGSTPA